MHSNEKTHRLELVQLRIRLISRFVCASFPKDFLELCEHDRFVQLVAVELESFDELLYRPFRFER
jgi:hypothetical protein